MFRSNSKYSPFTDCDMEKEYMRWLITDDRTINEATSSDARARFLKIYNIRKLREMWNK